MTFIDNNNDTYDMSDLTDLEVEEYSTGLCIPQDPIEDLEWFPSFSSNLISLGDLCKTPEHEPYTAKLTGDLSPVDSVITPEQNLEKTEDKKRVLKRGLEPFSDSNFPNKKQRSKRVLKQRQGAWSSSAEGVFFVSEKWSPESEELAAEDNLFRIEKRRCSHCQTDKTPQWRIGPLGPKTLCNACGVRHKSGRLVAEYRPAASPTFNSLQHSNFHKRILKRKGGVGLEDSNTLILPD